MGLIGPTQSTRASSLLRRLRTFTSVRFQLGVFMLMMAVNAIVQSLWLPIAWLSLWLVSLLALVVLSLKSRDLRSELRKHVVFNTKDVRTPVIVFLTLISWFAIGSRYGAIAATLIVFSAYAAVLYVLYTRSQGGERTHLIRPCPHCGYDRRLISSRLKCPECGRSAWL